MAATARLLRTPKKPYLPSSSSGGGARTNRSFVTAELGGEKRLNAGVVGEKRPAAVKAAAPDGVLASEISRVDLVSSLLANAVASGKAMKLLDPPPLTSNSWTLQLQMVIEKGIIDCRFFTLFAVLGSLLGSVLCFLEGCIIVAQSYMHYFHDMLSHKSDQHVVHLLIEAIDMFLVGTAMLIFGMGLYFTYVGTDNTNGKESWPFGSNLFGLFNLKTLPSWVEMQTVSQAKSKIGHAVVMILQVGVLEKFKSVPLETGLDLACFAASLLFSSLGVFVLSRLSMATTTTTK